MKGGTPLAQFQNAAHHGRKAMQPGAAVHTASAVGKQGQVGSAAQLPFPLHSAPGSSPQICADYTEGESPHLN